jgi:transcriptional regulator with XRE-family HTH domain
MATSFGSRLRELRKKASLTQRQLASSVEAAFKARGHKGGFDVTYLSKIENGMVPPPSAAAILQLAKELKADADELLALAGKAPADVAETLQESEHARTFYRSAVNAVLTEEEWAQLAEKLDHIRRKRKDE